MQPEEIKTVLENNIPDSQVTVSTDDGKHIAIVVVSPAFEGLTPVKKQQLVYAHLQPAIADGSLHAVQMKTLTPAEWSDAQG